jgi:hypothetical protein
MVGVTAHACNHSSSGRVGRRDSSLRAIQAKVAAKPCLKRKCFKKKKVKF